MAGTARKPRFVALVRVSTEGQLDGFGLDAQKAAVRKYARENNLKLLRIVSDEGISGAASISERPGLSEAISLISEGQADGLIVPTLDRLARSITNQEAILSFVWSRGGQVHAADSGLVPEDDPNDPMRSGMRLMVGVFSQIERGMIAKRMSGGRKAKAASGGYAGGRPPYGYMADRKTKELIPHDTEMERLTLIREWHNSGDSYAAIAHKATENKWPTPGHTRGTPIKKWHVATVSRILDPEAAERARISSQKRRDRIAREKIQRRAEQSLGITTASSGCSPHSPSAVSAD